MLQTSAYSKILTPEIGSLLLQYEGECTHETIVHLSKELEQSLLPIAGARFKKVFGIFIELIQNIKNYSAERSISTPDKHDRTGDGIGIIRVSEESRCFTVSAGNCIRSEDFERIQQKCERVKNTPTEELRSRYNEQLRQNQEPTSKGAGVGFLDIALKAGGNWEYEFHPMEENRVFFLITAYIAKSKIADDEAKPA